MVFPYQPNSENGRVRRDVNSFSNQTQNSSKRQVGWFQIHSGEDEVFQLKKAITRLVLGNKHYSYRLSWQRSPRFQCSVNETESLCKVCRNFCLLEQKVQQACQTCQTYRCWNWGVNQTQIQTFPNSTVFRMGTNQTNP